MDEEANLLMSVCLFQVGEEIGYTVHNLEGDEPEDVTDQYELANVEVSEGKTGFAVLKKSDGEDGD